MSSKNVEQSPPHFMVLDAIARGTKSADKISKATKISKSEVDCIVSDLVTQRLAVQSEKKGFLGGKKVELGITETGQKLLNAKKAELQEQAAQVQQWYQNGNTAALQNYVDNNRAWIPMMMFSGIMNVMFFMSMMSFMDMALSPAESSFAGTDSGMSAADYTGGADPGSGGDFSGGDFGGGDISF